MPWKLVPRMWIKPGVLDLTYCTNIHPGETWKEVRANVEQFGSELKNSLSPTKPFGIGLRLSALAAEELLQGTELDEFKSFLDTHGLYVAVLNGFPFGSFHCVAIKSAVFAPDWQDDARLQYTLNLVKILVRLVPAGGDGGISTSPLSYKPWLTPDGISTESMAKIVSNLVCTAEAMARAHQESGCLIHLDIEPEPDGLVENTQELIRFFEEQLCPAGAPLLAESMRISLQEANQLLLEHIRVCFDTCHMAVEYEDAAEAFRQFADRGIKIGRIQVSSALCAEFGRPDASREEVLSQLEPFVESVYLHQVIERNANGALHHYTDLGHALESAKESAASEWRIHYHVPIFTGDYGLLSSNQETNRSILAAVVRDGITSHLEIETYTWDVLPAPLKTELVPSIVREYQWVLGELSAAR